MGKINKKKLSFFLLFLVPWIALAQPSFEIDYPLITGFPTPTLGGKVSAQDLANYIQYIFYFAILAGIILALVILVLGGLRYLYSAGNPQVQSQARSQITNALVGLILLLVSYTLLVTIRPEFGKVVPVQLREAKIVVNTLRRVRRTLPWREIVEQLEPSFVPLEVTYPTAGGFRPEFIPFTTPAAPHLYPLEKLVARYGRYLYDFSFMVGVILALLFIIIGGIKHLTAAGNIAQTADARDQIFSSLLGLLLLLGSYLILTSFRPEFATIDPAELEETEIEIEPGVYLCTHPMDNNINNDLMARVCRCRDLKTLSQTYGGGEFINQYNKECFFTKRQKKELSTFISLNCFLIQSSETLPPELIGEPVDIKKVEEELEKLKEKKLISDDEYNEIVNGWREYNASRSVVAFTALYINGNYGVILHQEKDFKGRGDIIMKHDFKNALLHFFPGNESFIRYSDGIVHKLNTNYFYRHDPKTINLSSFKSVTLFEDRVVDCVLKTPAKDFFVDISDCLEIKNFDDVTFFFYNVPDFGTLEEKEKNLGYIVMQWAEFFSTTGGRAALHTLARGGHGGNVNLLTDLLRNPIYSLKLPAEERWIVVVGAHTSNQTNVLAPFFSKLYVLNKSERNFEATYVRSFCQKGDREYPCISHFFAYPGKMVRQK